MANSVDPQGREIFKKYEFSVLHKQYESCYPISSVILTKLCRFKAGLENGGVSPWGESSQPARGFCPRVLRDSVSGFGGCFHPFPSLGFYMSLATKLTKLYDLVQDNPNFTWS